MKYGQSWPLTQNHEQAQQQKIKHSIYFELCHFENHFHVTTKCVRMVSGDTALPSIFRMTSPAFICRELKAGPPTTILSTTQSFSIMPTVDLVRNSLLPSSTYTNKIEMRSYMRGTTRRCVIASRAMLKHVESQGM